MIDSRSTNRSFSAIFSGVAEVIAKSTVDRYAGALYRKLASLQAMQNAPFADGDTTSNTRTGMSLGGAASARLSQLCTIATLASWHSSRQSGRWKVRAGGVTGRDESSD
jgi:hypothetical protein